MEVVLGILLGIVLAFFMLLVTLLFGPFATLLVLLLGAVPAMIARRKGRNFTVWWLFGCLLFIVALPYSLLLEQRETGSLKQCPFCREFIKRGALVCKHCGREVLPELPETHLSR
jgi:hypothetical protein